jgi:nucleoside-diphosphate-sugar epimerase
MHRIIFGCGYLGERVAARWLSAGDQITVVTRSEARARHVRQIGYETIVADITRPETLASLPTADTVLFAVGYDRDSERSIAEVYAGGIQNVLNNLPSGINRFIYISTTGVYGSAGGEWVDETTPTDPQRDGGRASHTAEQVLTNHPAGASAVILRLAGIYGPGRIPFLNELRHGHPIAVPSAGYLNLVHVDDAAATVIAASELSLFDDGPHVYCVSDGRPVGRAEFYREVARQIGAPPPKFVEPDAMSPRAERARGNRQIRNDKMLAELQVELAYPDYRAGVAAILETENQ